MQRNGWSRRIKLGHVHKHWTVNYVPFLNSTLSISTTLFFRTSSLPILTIKIVGIELEFPGSFAYIFICTAKLVHQTKSTKRELQGRQRWEVVILHSACQQSLATRTTRATGSQGTHQRSGGVMRIAQGGLVNRMLIAKRLPSLPSSMRLGSLIQSDKGSWFKLLLLGLLLVSFIKLFCFLFLFVFVTSK